MSKNEMPLNARSVALRLGTALSTLNGWLSADEEHPAHERRFAFHTYRGRKRLWSEAGFVALERAIEIESEPGGVLGGWRSGYGSRAASAHEAGEARKAMLCVLAFHHDGDPATRADLASTAGDEDSDAGEAQGCPRL